MRQRHRFDIDVLVCFGAIAAGCGGWIELDGSRASGGTSPGSAGVGKGAQGGSSAMTGGRSAAAAAGHEAHGEGGSDTGGAPSNEAGSDPRPASGGRFVVLEALAPQLVPEGADAPDVVWRGTAAIDAGSLHEGVLVGTNYYDFEHEPNVSVPGWYSREPFVWTEATGMVALDGLSALGSRFLYPESVSPDGKTVVGGFNVPTPGLLPPNTFGETFGGFFRWRRGQGVTTFGEPPGILEAQIDLVNSAGTAAVGLITTATVQTEPFLWTEPGGFLALEEEVLGWPSDTGVSGMSEDGSTLFGFTFDYPSIAFRWTAAGGVENLGTLPGFESCVTGRVSPDAKVVLGSCWNQTPQSSGTFVWTEQDGMKPIRAAGTAVACDMSFKAIAKDSSTGVGDARCGTESYSLSRWQADTGVVALPAIPGRPGLYDLREGSLSRDGKVAFGTFLPTLNGTQIWPGDPGMEAVRFRETQQPVALGFSPGHELSSASAADAQGNVLAGLSGFKRGEQRAVLWDDQGILDIAADLSARGVDLRGVALHDVAQVKVVDSTVMLLGTGRNDLSARTWLAWLPAR